MKKKVKRNLSTEKKKRKCEKVILLSTSKKKTVRDIAITFATDTRTKANPRISIAIPRNKRTDNNLIKNCVILQSPLPLMREPKRIPAPVLQYHDLKNYC